MQAHFCSYAPFYLSLTAPACWKRVAVLTPPISQGRLDLRSDNLPNKHQSIQTFLLRGWLNIGTGCPEKLYSLHPWRYSKTQLDDTLDNLLQLTLLEQGLDQRPPELPPASVTWFGAVSLRSPKFLLFEAAPGQRTEWFFVFPCQLLTPRALNALREHRVLPFTEQAVNKRFKNRAEPRSNILAAGGEKGRTQPALTENAALRQAQHLGNLLESPL